MTSRYEKTGQDQNVAHTLARGLGWFSLALGMTEMLAPRALAQWLGKSDSVGLIKLYGAREIATGIGILGSENPIAWMWGRVGGDALDIATLAGAVRDDGNPKKGNAGLALAAVGGVAVLDLVCAMELRGRNGDGRNGMRRRMADYSDRTGFRLPPEQLRGAARDFEVPADYRVPEALRPISRA